MYHACEICGELSAYIVCKYQPYLDYEFEVNDCETCQSRYIVRDAGIYEKLHKDHDNYLQHQDFSALVKEEYENGTIDTLRLALTEGNGKNAFIIDAIEKWGGESSRVLEIGCSAGHLTSYALKKGFDVTACDVSETAVSRARENFPDGNFVVVRDSELPEGTFDIIYHAGTIGCVTDPVGFTNRLLDKLTSGGRLIFNAPNRESVDRFGVPWVRGTAPPDLVTLFPVSFWKRFKSHNIDVSTTVAFGPSYSTPAYMLQSLGFEPSKRALFETQTDRAPASSTGKRFDRVKAILSVFGVILPMRRAVDDFGVYVSMQKR